MNIIILQKINGFAGMVFSGEVLPLIQRQVPQPVQPQPRVPARLLLQRVRVPVLQPQQHPQARLLQPVQPRLRVPLPQLRVPVLPRPRLVQLQPRVPVQQRQPVPVRQRLFNI
jgi:hypothetical protein